MFSVGAACGGDDTTTGPGDSGSDSAAHDGAPDGTSHEAGPIADSGGDATPPAEGGVDAPVTDGSPQDVTSSEAGPDATAEGGPDGAAEGGPDGAAEGGPDGAAEGGPDGAAEGGLVESGSEAGPVDASGSDASDASADAGCVTLTVKNFKNWCSVSVAGGSFSASATQTVCVAPGTVNLVAAPASNAFILGLWHHTSGDTGSGDPGVVTGEGGAALSTTTASVSGGSKCVWVCCPFPDGSGCPTADQCH
jgi:hypothetical protein